LPVPAGFIKDRGDEGVATSMKMKSRPDTPPKVRMWRQSGKFGPGHRELQSVLSTMTFGRGGIKASDHVGDVWCQPGADTDMNRLKLGMAETVYRSSKREPLGRSYLRGHQLPEKVMDSEFAFGEPSNKSQGAKTLIYPRPTEEQMKGLDLYRRSHSSYPPGEQRRREYKWDIDIRSHKFGQPPDGIALNGASPNIAAALRMDGGNVPAPRLTSKRTEDFKKTHDSIGRARNLGYASRDHMGKVSV
ncbi:unnamed protein product, partial [Choristocarpus tenellus]